MKKQTSFKENNAKIYLVATPIGNLNDITFRAIETLKMVDLIYCEDTRTSLKLLNHYDIKKPLKSVHLFNESDIAKEIIETVKNGKSIAIISDAGLPIISDPGSIVVKEAIKEDIDVVTIPGANAALTALVASGLPSKKFYFVGFLNHKRTKKKEELKELINFKETIILYESPHKLQDTLELIDEIFGQRNLVIARELTKIHEEYLRTTAKEALEVIDSIKGEIVILIEGAMNNETYIDLCDLTIEEHYNHYILQGINAKDALGLVAKDRNISKKEVYNIVKK